MNNCTFVGRLGSDAEVRYTTGGTAVAGFSLAVDVGYGDRKNTLWLRCQLWGKRAEGKLVEYLKKGQQVAVSGEISMNEWEDKSGVTQKTLELKINELELVGGKSGGSGRQNTQQNAQRPAPQAASQPPQNNIVDDDIPF